MKKLFFLLVLLGVAGSLGYLLGTEKGRAQRDVLLVKMGRGPADAAAPGAETADLDLAAAVEA